MNSPTVVSLWFSWVLKESLYSIHSLCWRSSHQSSSCSAFSLYVGRISILSIEDDRFWAMMENVVNCFFFSFAQVASIRHPPTSSFELIQRQISSPCSLSSKKKKNNFQGDPRVPYKIGGANPRSSIEKRRAKRFNWKSTTLRVQPDHFIICISTNYLSLQHSKESFHPIQLLILEQSWKTRISYSANPLLLPYLSYPSILAMAMECNLKKPLQGVKWSHHLSFPNFILLPFPTLRGS